MWKSNVVSFSLLASNQKAHSNKTSGFETEYSQNKQLKGWLKTSSLKDKIF